MMIRYKYVMWDWFLMFIYLLVNKVKMCRNNIYCSYFTTPSIEIIVYVSITLCLVLILGS